MFAFQRTLVPLASKRMLQPSIFRPLNLVQKQQPMLMSSPLMMGATSFRSFNATTLNVEAEKNQTNGPVPIKVTKNQEYSAMDLLKDEISKVQSSVTPVCFYPRTHKKEHEKRWAGTKKDIHYSKWKLNAVAGLVRNTSLIEARSILANADKKGADYILEVLQELEDQGVRRGINPE